MFYMFSIVIWQDRGTHHYQHDLSSNPEVKLLREPGLLVQHLCCILSSQSHTSGSLTRSIVSKVDDCRTIASPELLLVDSVYVQLPG